MSDLPALPAALTEIVSGASDAHAARQVAGAGLPLEAMQVAARRRRTTFTTGVGLVAAAAVGALVLGGAAAGGLLDRDAAPPAQTPDSSGLVPDYSLCGQRSPDWGGAVAVPITLFSSGEVLVDSQALLTLETLTGGTEAFPAVTVQKVGTRHDIVAFNGAGTVVGVLGEPVDGATDELVPYTSETASLTTTAPLLSCAAQDGVTGLEPGSYGLTVSRRVEVLTDDGAQEVRAAYSPVLTIPEPPTGHRLDALPATTLDGAVPQCGAPVNAPPAGDAAISIRLDGAVKLDAGIVSTMRGAFLDLTNNLPGARTIQVAEGGVQLLITEDGVVVGHGTAGMSDAPFPFEPGTTRAVEFSMFPYDCSALGEVDLPAGEYEIWAFVPIAGDSPASLVAGPWPVTAAP